MLHCRAGEPPVRGKIDQSSSGADSTNQLPGTSGSYSGSSNLCKGRSSISILLRIDNTIAVAYINRKGGSVCDTFTSGKDPVAVVHGEEHLIGNPAPTRSYELHCRQGVQSLARRIRLETLTQDIPDDQSPIDGPICKLTFQSGPHICQLEARPSALGNRCIHSDLLRRFMPTHLGT